MAVAAVDLINAALRKVGSRDISAIDATTPGGAIANNVYTFERDTELRNNVWNFAKTRVRLARLSVTPNSDFLYAYGLPSDWIRTIAVYDNDAASGMVIYKQEAVLTNEAITNGAFDADTGWTKGTGWTIGSGLATKAAGAGSDLSQATTFTASKIYRTCFLVQGMSAGTITPKFTGGVTVTGTARTVDGYYVEELTADAGGNTSFVLTASSTFNGSIDDASSVRMDGAAAHAILSSAEAIFIRYVRQVINPDQMTPDFRQVLILRMAKVFALGLANSSTYTQMLDDEMKTAMRNAKSIGGIEDWPDQLPDGSWTTSRFAGQDQSRFSWARRW